MTEPGSASDATRQLIERREFPRLALEPGFQARFLVGDLLVEKADLLDLSLGGCCLRLPLSRCEDLQRNCELEEFHFLHPDLPKAVVPARVTWVLGKAPAADAPAKGRYCLVGVAFAALEAALLRELEQYLKANLP